jgi:hypothetical protein
MNKLKAEQSKALAEGFSNAKKALTFIAELR